MGKINNDIRFDFDTCFGRGKIPAAMWRKNLALAKAAAGRLAEEVADGKLGFWQLPGFYLDKKNMAPIKKAANEARAEFDNMVAIGIGGSSLGARMLKNALTHRYYNEQPKYKRSGMRFYLLENDDPDSFTDLLDHLDLSRTIFNVVSKSGSTAETASQFILIRDRLKGLFPGTWKRHLIFTTDPENGILRKLADEEGIETLNIPQNTGGRYSVLCPVGLFPAQVMGVQVKELLKGAEAMAARCLSADPKKNPALAGALIHILADRELGKNMLVAYPYADRLRDWTEWFCQLWAESLGKAVDESGKKINCGSTPIKALGAIDQHSQSQLYMEGPNDKVFMFLRVTRFGQKVGFPAKNNTPADLQYLAGHNMQELIQAEETATRFALGKAGRMTYELTLPRVNAHSLGQLIFWAEAMTVLGGYLYGVNPFDQPGVELSKKFTYGLMGRKGFESYRDQIKK